MSKAACCSTKLTRRAAIVATLAGVATPAVAVLPDPAFAAIAAHKAAYARLDTACRCVSRLERQVPAARRKEWYAEDRGTNVGANDDPRWKAAMTNYWAAFDAETQTAWALARAQPAGLAGASALLRHAYEFEAGGDDWPGEPEEDDGDEWSLTFHRSLAAALEALA